MENYKIVIIVPFLFNSNLEILFCSSFFSLLNAFRQFCSLIGAAVDYTAAFSFQIYCHCVQQTKGKHTMTLNLNRKMLCNKHKRLSRLLTKAQQRHLEH